MVIDRRSSAQVVDRKAFLRNYHLHDTDETKVMALWEYLDPAASAAFIKAGGRAVEYGAGVKGAMAEFDENRRSQAKEETGAGLSIGAWSALRSRLGKEKKKEAEVGVAASAEAKTAKRERVAAAARAVIEPQHQNDVDVCDLCATRFLSASGLARHRNSGCGKRTTIIEKEKRKARRVVVRRPEAMDELVIEGNRQPIRDLAIVTVDLSAPESTTAVVGIEVEDDGGGLVITAIAELALGSWLAGEGFVVVSVGGGPATADSTRPQSPAHPAALAFVSYGVVLVRVRVRPQSPSRRPGPARRRRPAAGNAEGVAEAADVGDRAGEIAVLPPLAFSAARCTKISKAFVLWEFTVDGPGRYGALMEVCLRRAQRRA